MSVLYSVLSLRRSEPCNLLGLTRLEPEEQTALV